VSTIAQLALQVQDRLEEPRDGVGTFWNVANEVNPSLVEGMNEAALITGDPEVRPNAFLTLQVGGNVPGMPPFCYAMPADAFLLVRIDAVGQGSIKKVLVGDLDRLQPGWEGQSDRQIKRWFPIGMTMFGVWPQLTGPQQVRITYVGFPTTDAYPYSGTDVSPFREEYNDGFVEYAAHICRLKESGVDFQESIAQYQSYLDKMVSLTKFAARRGISRFTRIGRQTKLNEIAVKG
jgi:hypothetical protein